MLDRENLLVFDELEQNTDEWYQTRSGLITASAMDQILTPAKLDLSKSRDTYFKHLAAERLVPDLERDFEGNKWTQRGHNLEADAITYFEELHDVEVTRIGFIRFEDREFGFSPDGIIEDTYVLQIKCLSTDKHLSYLLGPPKPPIAYRLQVQTELFISKCESEYLMLYHPQLPSIVYKIEPDLDVHQKIDVAVAQAEAEIDEYYKRLMELQGKK